MDLYGEDGRLLSSELLQLNTAYRWAYFYWELPFETASAGELGRLSMNIQDGYGRITALNSVHLILVPEGYSIINPPGNLKERCVLEEPVTRQVSYGGLLRVRGEIRPFNNLPLVVELVAQDGSVLGSQTAAFTPPAGDDYVPFQVDLAYAVSSGMEALLIVRETDDRIGGTMYLFSREVLVNP